ncbi:MAG: hypothetical protein AB7W59_25390, partial [Acidimicrobiia bacterium]
MALARSTVDPDELEAILAGRHGDPHRVLGLHRTGAGWVIRARHPLAERASVVAGGAILPMVPTHPDGMFELEIGERPESGYRLVWQFRSGERQS